MAPRKIASKNKQTASKRPGAGNGGVVPPVETRFGPGNQAAVGHGRPRKLAELKELILETLAEEVTGQTPEGVRITMTRAQQMIRTMLLKSPSDRMALLEYGFGKVVQPTANVDWREWAKENGYDPDSLVEEFASHMGNRGDSERSVRTEETGSSGA